MDFNEYTYTAEQEQFRVEVRKWLDENVPTEARIPAGAMGGGEEETSDELMAFARELHYKLGQKGWLYPTYPREYGGGGLTGDQDIVLQEELRRNRVPRYGSNGLVNATLLVWGTEAQRMKYLVPLLKGEWISYQSFTEPQSGSDLANIKSTAVREGDEWVVNGHKLFVSGPGPANADILFGPLLTDPDAPRHRNLGYFLIPGKAPGVQLVPMRLLNGSRQHFVYYDDVHIPGDALVGGDHEGWQVTNTTLEEEHGGRGAPAAGNDLARALIDHMRTTERGGALLGQDPLLQQLAVETYIDSRLGGLFTVRNYSMYSKRMEMSYEGSQSAAWTRESAVRNSRRAQQIVGPYGHLEHDPRAPQRDFVAGVSKRLPPHAGGTTEIQKTIVARRLGISRTPERAAPTPATATQFTG
jgi:alkylation response protein AidB-like acyl-CoA dehydrogenase